MKSGTQIAEWQLMTNVQNVHNNPFHFTIIAELSKAILQATEWVEKSSSIDTEYWKRYRSTITKAVESNFTDWGTSPDPKFNSIWVYKFHALTELHLEIHTLYVKYAFNPYQSDVYKEKTDQAIDFLTSDETDMANYPLLQVDCEVFSLHPGAAARNILNQRGLWINRMAAIERIRIQSKMQLLSAPTKTEASVILDKSINDLKRLNSKWT